MGYSYLDDVATADIAFEAWGKTAEEVFASAADAMMFCMVENLNEIEKNEQLEISLDADSLEMLLYNFLHELIFYKDAREILLRPATITINAEKERFTLNGTLEGEKIDREKHHLNVDIKAVTMHRFELKKTKEGYHATVIVDI